MRLLFIALDKIFR